MRKTVEFIIYIAGVVFFSWNYYRLKDALDIVSLLIFAALYLFGVSKLATFTANKLAALLGQKAK